MSKINLKKYQTTRGLKARLCFALLFFVTIVAVGGQVSAQAVDPTFDAKINNAGFVYAAVVQSNGKILVGGDFILANGQARSRIVRFNADGSIDTSFNASADNTVYSVAVQTDGKILIGGTFTAVNGAARGRIARLNADGSLDAAFDTSVGASSGIVYTINRQADGKVLVGGSFTNVNGTAINRIARLNADGTLDAAFNVGTGASSTVYDIELQPDGKILVGGGFTTFNTVASSRVVRLNADGSMDATFVVGTGGSSIVYALALQADGKIVIGGAFTTFNGTSRNRIARLNADGALDMTFDPGTGANTIVYSLALEADGDIVFGGTFTTFNDIARERIARVNSVGTLDAAFTASAENQVRTISMQADGKIIVGGSFVSVNTVSKAGAARLNADGTLDNSFSANVFDSATVRVITPQPDGKILVGGFFEYAGLMPRQSIARFNADGTPDTAFNSSGAGADSTVYAIAVQTDGKILVGGAFGTYNGAAQPTIVRLNADGSVDASFTTVISATSVVYAVTIQPDGKILIGGTFINVNGTAINRIARLNADGTLDAAFNVGTGASGTVYDIELTAANKIYIGGTFTTVNGATRGRIARLNADGTLDTAFDPGAGASGTVYNIALQPDGKIYIGGAFTTYQTIASVRIARLNADGALDTTFNAGAGASSTVYSVKLQPDGKVLIVGVFVTVNGVALNRIARLNTDGTVDGTFNVGTGADNIIYELAKQADGKFLIGGSFTSFNGVPKSSIARLSIVSKAARADFDGDGRTDLSVFRPSNGTWFLNRSSAGFYAQQFGVSTDQPVPADYDGDGKTDLAVWRAGSLAYFYIFQSSNNTFRFEQFGQTGDVPTVGDWDGDGKADASVYRDSAVGSQSFFYFRATANNPNAAITFVPWGQAGDRPLRGDFDGDGKADAAIFRPSNNRWFIRQSSNGQSRSEQFGLGSDLLVPADYDGDGKTDLAVYRAGDWYILQSSNNQVRYEQFGAAADVPVPGDYDGDGRDDIAVYRNGIWYIKQSTSGLAAASFGVASDKPLPGQ